MAFCTKCGTQLPDGATFCTTCGAALEGAPAASAPQAAPAPQMQPQQPQMQAQPMPQPQPMPQQPQMQPQQPQMQQIPPYQQMPQQFQQPYQQPRYARPNTSDHTAEFGNDDVKKFKYVAAAIYAVVAGIFFVTLDGLGLVPLFKTLLNNADVLINGGWALGSASFMPIGIFTLLMTLTAGLTSSDYLRFHATQGSKLMCMVVGLCIVRMIPVAGPVIFYVGILAIMVFAIISLIQTICGKSVEPIITSFLK